MLWRFLSEHEPCVAEAASTTGFELVTSVPSGDGTRDERHPLRSIVGELVAPTRERHERLLRRSELAVPDREFDARRYECVSRLHGESVLLIDDVCLAGLRLARSCLLI